MHYSSEPDVRAIGNHAIELERDVRNSRAVLRFSTRLSSFSRAMAAFVPHALIPPPHSGFHHENKTVVFYSDFPPLCLSPYILHFLHFWLVARALPKCGVCVIAKPLKNTSFADPLGPHRATPRNTKNTSIRPLTFA